MAQGAFTADFVFSIEKRLRNIAEYGYMKMLSSENIWYPKIVRPVNLDGKSERVNWLLSTASIEQLTATDGGENAGSLNFDELATITQEYFVAFHARGYKIGKMKYLNFLNGGIDPVARWVGDIATYGAYYPQRLSTQALLYGENTVGYDGANFFATNHPVHPLIPSLGTYANLFTGASSGTGPTFYPGALPIDDTQSIDVALQNLGKALAYITGFIAQPNGAGDPRFLEPLFIMHPPRMTARVNQLCDADYIPQIASSGAGSADIRAFLKKYRIIEPVLAKEFDGGRSYSFLGPAGVQVTATGDDKTYYIVCREASETQLGCLLHHMRQPFTLHTYSGEQGAEGIDAILGRSQDLEWHYDGYQAINLGHPYTIFKFKGS